MHNRGSSSSKQLSTLLPLASALAAATLAAVFALTLRRRRAGVAEDEWAEALQECGTISCFEGIVAEVLERGIDPRLRADVWPFLLEVFSPASTFAQRQQQHTLMTRQYQQLLLQCQAYEAVLKESLRPVSPTTAAPAAAVPPPPRGSPQHSSSGRSPQQSAQSPLQQQQQQQQQVQLPEQVRQFAEAHRIIVIDALRTDYQKHTAALQQVHGGAAAAPPEPDDPSSPHAPDSSSYAAGIGVAAVAAGLVSQGLSTLQQWQQYWLCNLLGGQAAAWGHQQALWVSEAAKLVLDGSPHLPDDSKRQASRMIAMLSAYALHDPDTGYSQGMSDLLLPFLLLMDDDALVFWCFVALMQHLGARHNFAVDESGIFRQLRRLSQVLEADLPLIRRLHQLKCHECHFAYRCVVVLMRRDMPMPQVMQLWEVLWAHSWQQRRLQQQQQQQQQQDAAAASDEPPPPSGAAPVAGSIGEDVAGSSSTSSSWRELPHVDLFICFVAAVVMSQRRAILDRCRDADDVLALVHSLRHVDVWACLARARQLLEQQQQQQQEQQQGVAAAQKRGPAAVGARPPLPASPAAAGDVRGV